jgi:hypothetical protein
MERSRKNRWGFRLAGALLVSLAVLQMSCGTLLYPERRGQKTGQLDVGVVLLDGAGLLLFVIPGVIAFAVDFITGAIYLPPSEKQFYEKGKAHVPPDQLTRQNIEEVVRRQTGKAIDLRNSELRVMRIENLDQFTPQTVSMLEASPTTLPSFEELSKNSNPH